MRRGVILKTATRVQGLAVAHAQAFFVQVADDAGVGKVLDQQLHHQHERPVLEGIDFEALAIVGDAQAVGDVLAECALGWGFRLGQLAPPLDRYHLPSGGSALPHDIGTEWPGNHIANAFKMRHGAPPLNRGGLKRHAIRQPKNQALGRHHKSLRHIEIGAGAALGHTECAVHLRESVFASGRSRAS